MGCVVNLLNTTQLKTLFDAPNSTEYSEPGSILFLKTCYHVRQALFTFCSSLFPPLHWALLPYDTLLCGNVITWSRDKLLCLGLYGARPIVKRFISLLPVHDNACLSLKRRIKQTCVATPDTPFSRIALDQRLAPLILAWHLIHNFSVAIARGKQGSSA